jgi:hypothetical protein
MDTKDEQTFQDLVSRLNENISTNEMDMLKQFTEGNYFNLIA